MLSLFFYFFGEEKRNSSVLLVSLVVLGFCFGVARLSFYEQKNTGNDFVSLRGETVSFSGSIIREPGERENGLELLIRPEEFFLRGKGTSTYSGNQNIIVTTPGYEKFSFGDSVSVSGKITPVAPSVISPGDFDASSYYKNDDVYERVSFARVSLVSPAQLSFRKVLLSGKEEFLRRIRAVIPAPESALTEGVLIGVKGTLPKESANDFRTTGLSHIIVFSGYNVGIVAVVLLFVFSFLPRTFSIIVTFLGVVSLGFFVGGDATVVRAIIMASFALLAKYAGREADAILALFAAAFLIIIFEPLLLVSSISFHLSFLATFGLIALSPFFEKKLLRTPQFLREILSATLSAQIFVAPYLLYNFGYVSIVGVVSNLLVLPVVPLIMFFGALAGISGFIFYYVSVIFGFVAYGFSAYALSVAHIFAGVPLATLQINFSLTLTLFLYLLLLLFCYEVRDISRNIKTEQLKLR